MSFKINSYTTPSATDRAPSDRRGGGGGISGTRGTLSFELSTKSNMSTSPFVADLAGVLDSVVALTQDLNTVLQMQGGHALIDVTGFIPGVPTREITLQGSSIVGVTFVPVVGDTEVISIPEPAQTRTYKSSKRWIQLTSVISSTAGLTTNPPSVLYAFAPLQLPDDIKVTGYEFEAVCANISNTGNVGLGIYKTTDDTLPTRFYLEDIVMDNGVPGSVPPAVTDSVRTGPDDRSYTGPLNSRLFTGNRKNVYQQLDFNEYMGSTSTKTVPSDDLLNTPPAPTPAANTQNIEFSKGDGLWIRLRSINGLLLDNVTYANLTLYYTYL